MDVHIQYKVYAIWGENEKPEVRRFIVDKNLNTSFQYLNSRLREIFPILQKRNYTVSWKDEEKDDVIIASDEELIIAINSMDMEEPKKLYVTLKEQQPKTEEIVFNLADTAPVPDSQAPSDLAHLGVVCDGCDGPVVGFRYKCTSCDDFDLCFNCEGQGLHSEHCMLRIPVPSLSQSVIRNATKRYRHFLKTVATSFDEEHGKKQRRERERSGDRRRRDHGYHHRHHNGDGDHHPRRKYINWLEIFGNYVNEFTNLAGDSHVETENVPKQPSANLTQEIPNKKTNGTQAQPQPTKGQKSNCPFYLEKMVMKNLEQDILNILPTCLSTPKPSTSQDSDHQPTPGPVNNEASQSATVNNEATQSATASNSQDVEMAEARSKSVEADRESIASEASLTKTVESKNEESSEKVDGWTVINKDNDLMDTDVRIPIGFNLPEEFQERVTISQGQNLYPPLNAGTAVLNPKEPERPTVPEPPKGAPSQASAKAQASANAPAAPTAPRQESQKQPKPQPKQPHHQMAHINAAIEQMLAMGFTNEGGWLTQLLENKDGNIAAVLDLLTPVNPKK